MLNYSDGTNWTVNCYFAYKGKKDAAIGEKRAGYLLTGIISDYLWDFWVVLAVTMWSIWKLDDLGIEVSSLPLACTYYLACILTSLPSIGSPLPSMYKNSELHYITSPPIRRGGGQRGNFDLILRGVQNFQGVAHFCHFFIASVALRAARNFSYFYDDFIVFSWFWTYFC